MRNPSLPLVFLGTVALSAAGASAAAQVRTPCGPATVSVPAEASHGLTPVDRGTIIYDANVGVCWLADANLAGHPDVRAAVPLSSRNPDGSTPLINPDGTMDYQTALNWVNALNSYNEGAGWLNHNNWQLPTNPASDTTCSSKNVDSFGVQCTGSALGALYDVGLSRTYPESVVPHVLTFVWPFFSLQPGLYWTSDASDSGQVTFSFNTGLKGANTTKYNFFHVLPMTRAALGPVPAGSGVLPYWRGPGAGKAVYDTVTGISWTLDANLPALDTFGVTGTTTLISNINQSVLTVPLVAKDGAVHFTAVDPANTASGWIVAMNGRNYGGTSAWELPGTADLQQLYDDMSIAAGDPRLEWPFAAGPFWRLQPGFYWACVRKDNTGSNGPCDYRRNASTPPGSIPFEWSFNLDDGFEGTDLNTKQFYVMVYYPAP